VRDLFGLTEHESLLGWVNVGTPAPLGRKKTKASTGTGPLDGRVLRLDA
jgi:hypothetical protein